VPLGWGAAPADARSRLEVLLEQAARGSGACLVVDRGAQAPMFCDAAAAEAERHRVGVRRAIGSPHPFGAFEAVCELFGIDVEAAEAAAIRSQGTGLRALRGLAERVDALCVAAPQLLLIDHAEHVDASSARFFGYLAQNLEARSVSLLLVAGDVPARSWLADVASASSGGVLRLRAPGDGQGSHPAARLARLDRPQRAVADALAVLGPGASLAAVAAVSDHPAGVLLEALDTLASHGLLRRTTTGAGHLVVADVVLDAMGSTRRAELHLRAAIHGRSVGESAIRLATHLEHVVPGSLDWAAAHLRAGAVLALQDGDAHAAVRWLRRAIEEDQAAGLEVPVRVLLELALAQSRAADPAVAATLRLAAERAGGNERARLHIRLGRQLLLTGRLREAAAVFDDVLAGIDPGDAHRELSIQARAGLVSASRSSLELRTRSTALLAQLADEVAGSEVDDPSVLAELAYEHALAGTCRDTVLALADRAAAAMGQGSLASASGHALFLALVWAEDLDAASALCDRLHDEVHHDPVGAHRRATIALADGDLDLAVACARVAVGDIEWVAPMLLPGARAQLARASVRVGDLDAAEVALRLPGGEGRWRKQAGYHPVLLARAELAAARGEWRQAATCADRCAEFSRAMGTRNPGVVPWEEVSARALASLGRPEEAMALLADAIRRAAAFGAPRALARLESTEAVIRGAAPEAPAAGHTTLTTVGTVPDSHGGAVLRLLGDTVLLVDGAERRLGDDLADRAVCVVGLARGGIHDEQLAEALWPDGDPAVGRNRLRNVLLRVRQRHGPVIERRGRTISLADHVTVDVHEFERLVEEFLVADEDVDAEPIGRRALELHRGELCPVHPFEPWASAPRDSVRSRWLLLADRMAHLAWQRGDLAGSLAITEQAIAVDRWDEHRYLDAAERLASVDRLAAARSMLDRCDRACADLGVATSPRHRSLAASLG